MGSTLSLTKRRAEPEPAWHWGKVLERDVPLSWVQAGEEQARQPKVREGHRGDMDPAPGPIPISLLLYAPLLGSSEPGQGGISNCSLPFCVPQLKGCRPLPLPECITVSGWTGPPSNPRPGQNSRWLAGGRWFGRDRGGKEAERRRRYLREGGARSIYLEHFSLTGLLVGVLLTALLAVVLALPL